jgi:hypothetical protein
MLGAVTSPLMIALLALTQAQISETDDGFDMTSFAFGTVYKSHLERDAILRSPAWDQEKSDRPPVSPKKAIRLAEKVRKAVVKTPDGKKWKVLNMQLLFEDDHCAWCVRFRSTPPDPEAGLIDLGEEVAFFVLMDGTVIEPTVEDLEGKPAD